ncbi:MAG: ribosome small subunit-dependent GTPase A [Bacteroidota bacterium]
MQSQGQVVKSTGSWYWVRTEAGTMIKARLRGKFKLEGKKITNPIAVGDRVNLEVLDDNDTVISQILPRKNYVIRASPRKRGHHHLLATNIDQAVLITSLYQPRTSLGFIDRFLVTLETFRIPGIVVINKADLYDDDDTELAQAILSIYEEIGYQGVLTSFANEDPAQLPELLAGKTSLLAGHSGTGKSSLVNLLIPDAKQKILEVSNFADKGVHSTTFAEMFPFGKDAYIIDTPGIKELGLAEIEEGELSHYFPEMRDLLGQCRFHNCQHISEPGCAIQAAVEAGRIVPSRYESYLSMMAGEDNRR